jgi:tRNA(His) 5'-end guanylyltransferase
MKSDSLGDRMKGYESLTQNKLMRRSPVIIRVDGKAFHTWTKKITKEIDPSLTKGPFSEKLHETMTAATFAVCSQVQNVEFAYTQSDEISFFLRDWNKFQSEQWFDAKVQKIVSVTSAMTTAFFNMAVETYLPELKPRWIGDIPLFDARAFNVPMEEVTNYFIWRQQDASRNSVQMTGHYFFSTKQMHGKNNSQVQDMLMEMDNPLNWNALETWKRRGSCVITNPNSYDSSAAYIKDEDIPIFTQERDYVECRLTPDEED